MEITTSPDQATSISTETAALLDQAVAKASEKFTADVALVRKEYPDITRDMPNGCYVLTDRHFESAGSSFSVDAVVFNQYGIVLMHLSDDDPKLELHEQSVQKHLPGILQTDSGAGKISRFAKEKLSQALSGPSTDPGISEASTIVFTNQEVAVSETDLAAKCVLVTPINGQAFTHVMTEINKLDDRRIEEASAEAKRRGQIDDNLNRILTTVIPKPVTQRDLSAGA